MGTYYAAISIKNELGGHILVPARKHISHRNREAALRATERAARRMTPNENRRGFVWPTSSPAAMQDGRWDEIETIAL